MAAQLDVVMDRSSPVPLYFQLAQAIESAIVDGRIAPGDRIENELDLAKRLNVSRPTTRQAIQVLVDKGLLVRKRGVGTQVIRSEVHRPVALTSLFEDLAAAGQKPETRLLEYTLGVPDEEVAAEFSVPADTPIVTIRRLRSANGEPLAIMENHIPAEFAPAPDELEERGFYECLRARGIHVQLARQRIGARAATKAEATLLGEKVPAALLTMRRVAFDDTGKPVELGRHLYRASSYFFDVTVIDR